MFKSFKKNFNSNVKKTDIAVDFSHRSGDKAAGWITQVILKEKNTQLWIKVEWTPEASETINNREFRYMSADFTTNYVDNETGKKFGATLNGAGLTNRPFIKDMEAVLSDVDIDDKKRQAIREILNDETPKEETEQMNKEELKAEIAKLSDAEKQDMGLIETKEVEVQLSDDESKEALKAEKAKNVKLAEKIVKQEKEAEFAVMLTDGDAVPAQKDAFMEDDVKEFAKLSVPINTKSEGSGEDPDPKKKEGEIKTFDEATDKVNELTEKLMEKEAGLTFSEASKKVLSLNPELNEVLETDLIA